MYFKKISIKKFLLLFVFAAGILNVQAQDSNGRKNDVMLSPIELIAGRTFNISYERFLNKNSGLGINLLSYLGKEDCESKFTQFSPYYRMYFGNKYAAGFFVEGFLPITMTTNYENYSNNSANDSVREYKRTSLGIGIGLGGKWITRNNITFEVSAGIARRFGESERKSFIFSEVYNYTGKAMLGIGYRF